MGFTQLIIQPNSKVIKAMKHEQLNQFLKKTIITPILEKNQTTNFSY